MELHSEIETLHAEHAHDTAVTQNELQAKTGEIRLLKQDLAVGKAKGSKDLQEAKLAHQTDCACLCEAILPSVVQDLHTDISTQFTTISQLTHKLEVAKAEAGDLAAALHCAKTEGALHEQKSLSLRAETNALKLLLTQTQDQFSRASTTIKELKEDLHHQTNLVATARAESKSALQQYTDQRSQVHQLREELNHLSLKLGSSAPPQTDPTLPTNTTDDQELCPWDSPLPPSWVTSPLPQSSLNSDEPSTDSSHALESTNTESWADTTDREDQLPPMDIPPTDQLPPSQAGSSPTHGSPQHPVNKPEDLYDRLHLNVPRTSSLAPPHRVRVPPPLSRSPWSGPPRAAPLTKQMTMPGPLRNISTPNQTMGILYRRLYV